MQHKLQELADPTPDLVCLTEVDLAWNCLKMMYDDLLLHKRVEYVTIRARRTVQDSHKAQ